MSINLSDTPQSLAESVAAEFKQICDTVILKNGKINVALSGGSTPGLLFEALSKYYTNKINWNKVFLFWVDERCVSPNDSDSNFGMTKKYLLNHVNIPDENVHRVVGENDPETEAKRYSEIIRQNVEPKNGFPEFDLILLGIGDDGHTASIFPDQIQLIDSNKISIVTAKPDSGQKRITLTGKVINNACRVYFLVAGKNKAEVVAAILNKKNNYLKYPASKIEPNDGELKWYLDKEAASLL